MNYALIFAGGVGSRMNSKALPKQFLEIHGKPIIIHTIEHFEKHSEIDAICVVCLSEWQEHLKDLLKKFNIKKVSLIVEGGKTALDSQYNGLCAVNATCNCSSEDIVLIHDGVRPLISKDLISDCIATVKEKGSAVTVSPAIETIIKTNAENEIAETIPRAECSLARAPQAFKLQDILGVHNLSIKQGKRDFIDSTSMMLYYGYTVCTVEGPAENIKVTTPSDFYLCRALLDARENMQIYGF